jgi:hypothetical protein
MAASKGGRYNGKELFADISFCGFVERGVEPDNLAGSVSLSRCDVFSWIVL